MPVILENIPVAVKDELLGEALAQSQVAALAPTTRVGVGDTLMTFSLGLEPAQPVTTSIEESNLPGEGGVKPVAGGNSFVRARAYKFAQIIPVSAEYRYNLPRLYDELIANAAGTIGLGVDNFAFNSVQTLDGFATFNAGDYAEHVTVGTGDTALYEALTAAFMATAQNGAVPNAVVGSPLFNMQVTTMTAQDGRPVFGTGADGIGRVFGAEVRKSELLGTGATSPVAIVGDWNKSRLGVVDDITLKIAEEATIEWQGEKINLFQQNMIGILVEAQVAFMVKAGAFARIGGATA